MVHRNGTLDASGTLLMIDFEWISWNVMPWKPGVSNVRVTALIPKRAGGCPPSGESRSESQRMATTLE
jgi:hypothetical protein